MHSSHVRQTCTGSRCNRRKDQKFLAVRTYAFTEVVCNFRVILAQCCTGTEETMSSLQKSPLLRVWEDKSKQRQWEACMQIPKLFQSWECKHGSVVFFSKMQWSDSETKCKLAWYYNGMDTENVRIQILLGERETSSYIIICINECMYTIGRLPLPDF